MEQSEIPKITAADLLKIDKLKITGHALEQFMLRGNLGLVQATQELKDRLASATPIASHPRLHLKPEKGSRFFQDARDQNTVYIIKERKPQKYYLASVLRPLRSGSLT